MKKVLNAIGITCIRVALLVYIVFAMLLYLVLCKLTNMRRPIVPKLLTR